MKVLTGLFRFVHGLLAALFSCAALMLILNTIRVAMFARRREIEVRARKLKLTELFVLTTKTAHWFLERGFRVAAVADLPQKKQALYNFQRKSLVYRKSL